MNHLTLCYTNVPNSLHSGVVVAAAAAAAGLSPKRGLLGGECHTCATWTLGRDWSARRNTRYQLVVQAEEVVLLGFGPWSCRTQEEGGVAAAARMIQGTPFRDVL